MRVIYVLLVAHFVADFVCQTDWMAQNKSKRWDALALHVAVYGAVLGAFAMFAVGRIGITAFLLPNILAHFAQDAITSRINSRFWQAKQVHWFFVGIGADQLLHYVTLFATAGWWLR